jgi:hypothetical protein
VDRVPRSVRSILSSLLLGLAGCSLLLDGGDFRSDDGDGGAGSLDPADAAPAAEPDGAPDPGADAAPEADAGADEVDASAPRVDAAGTYTLTVLSGDNACQFDGWQEGSVATGVPLVVDQDGAAVSAVLEGAPGLFATVVLGSNQLEGQVAGDRIEASLYGTRAFMQGSCTYTINANVDATLQGDFLDGQIEYRPTTNGSPACGVLNDCASIQSFNGTRPPG